MGYSPTERNPLGLSCSQFIAETSSRHKLGSERLLLHTLSSSEALHGWESSRYSMRGTCCLSADGSEASTSSYSTTAVTSPPRHITRAKELLNEACSHFTSSPACMRSSGPPRQLPHKLISRHITAHDGSLGPLLALLYDCHDSDKVACCLDTLAFLLLDEANRRELQRLGGVNILMDILGRCRTSASSANSAVTCSAHSPSCTSGGQSILLAAAQAVATLVAQDPFAKARVWAHDHSAAILDLLSPKRSSCQLLEALALVSRLALDAPSSSSMGSRASRPAASRSRPVDARLVGAVAALLHPAAHGSVLRAALAFLRQASALGGCDARTWSKPLFALAPLLSQPLPCRRAACNSSIGSESQMTDSCNSSCHACAPALSVSALSRRCTLDGSILEASVQLLSSLSDQPKLHGAVYAAGCLPPLLPLLSDASSLVRVPAACTLANMVEHPLARQQLLVDPLLSQLLQAVSNVRCSEVGVGLLYILSRLIAQAPVSLLLCQRMRQQGVVAALDHLACLHSDDQDVVLGVKQLLDLLA